MFLGTAKYLFPLTYSGQCFMQSIPFFLPAAMMWTVGMAKPDTAARGPSQQTWDAGLFACPSPIQSTVL